MQSNYVRKTLLSTAVALAAAGIAAPLVAAEPGGEAPVPVSVINKAVLEETLVSARKVVESMQDVSVSMTAFSGTSLDNLNIRDVRELEGMVPNLVIDSVSVSPAGASIYIRGVGTQEVERSFDPAVGVVIDGVPLSFVNGSMRNTFDFQSIEILRGPQGTLFGRNTTGGVMNVTRTRPTGELGVKFEGTAGTDELVDYKTVVNFPLGEMFAGKLGYARQTGGGMLDNVTTGEDVGDADNRELNATLLFAPNDKFDALFTYVNYLDKSDGIPLQNLSSLNADNSVNSIPETPCIVGPIFGLDACGDDVTDLQKVSQDFYGRNIDFEWDSYTLNLNYDVGVGTVTTIIGYQETDEVVATDFDASALNFFHVIRTQDSEQTSAEIRFASSDELSERMDFVAGVFYVTDEYTLVQETSIAAFAGPDDAFFQNPTADHERDAWAVFGEVHFDLTDQLMLTVGGRYTEEEKDYTGTQSFGGGVNNGLLGYLPTTPDDFYVYGLPIFVPIESASADEKWDEFSPKIGLDYRVNDDILTYLTYSEGFRSGGFNGRNTNFANIGPFDPETVSTYELGFKSDLLDQTLRLNFAAFYNEYDDKQEEIIEPDGFGGTNTVVRNAATVQIFGLEGEMTWVASEHLLVNANFGYLDAEYDDYDADLNGDGIVTDNSDLELRRVPEWTAGINAKYSYAIGPGELSLFGSYRYTDEYWVEVSNDPRGLLDSRGVVDATIAYDWDCGEGKSMRVALYGRDMTDEVDFNSAVVIPGNFAFGAISGGEQYGVRISGNF